MVFRILSFCFGIVFFASLFLLEMVEAETVPVSAELVAERTAIARDKPFSLGVHFRIAPGWHIYWRNPGEAGKATSVVFDPAEGFTADTVRWPAPESFFQGQGASGQEGGSGIANGLQAFGYSNETLLFGNMSPLPNVVNGARLIFKAKVHWLACDDSRCVPGAAEPSLTLSVRVLTESELNTRSPLFDKFQKLLPEPVESSSFVKSFEQVVGSGDSSRSATSVVKVTWNEPVQPTLLAAYQDDYYFLKSSRIKTLAEASDVAALFESRLENAPANRVVYTNLMFKLESGELRAVELPFSLAR